MKRNTKFRYRDFSSRNKIFIDQALQKKIQGARLLFAGCGLGSLIAETAVRLGFSQFVLADGDQVELSNLNRQSFDLTHLGLNKAFATASVLRKINPEANIQVFDKFIKPDDVSDLINNCDFIINTVDVNKVYFDLVDTGQRENKEVLLPFNMGFGSLVVIFNQKSESLPGILKMDLISDEVDFFTKLFEGLKIKDFPVYFSKKIPIIYSCFEKKGYSPQIRIGADIAAAIVSTCLIKIISGENVPLAPKYHYRDLY